MKSIYKSIFSLVTIAFLVFGCENEIQSPFPADRNIEGETAKIEQALMGAEYGWKMVFLPEGNLVGGYHTVVKFNADGRAEIVSEYRKIVGGGTTAYDATIKQENIEYRIKKVTNFELAFETYSFFHKLYDLGYTNSAQFKISLCSEDSICLADGNSEFYMTKAQASDWNMTTINLVELEFFKYKNASTLYNFLGGDDMNTIQLGWDTDARSMSYYFYNEAGVLQVIDRGYYYTPKGIMLKEPVQIYGVGELQYFDFVDVTPNGKTMQLNVKINGEKNARFYSSVHTIVPSTDGLEHFHLIEGSSANSGKFWSNRVAFERGFTYGDSTTYFGLEKVSHFTDFNIYLDYYNARIDATYDNFTFVFVNPETNESIFHNVYFTYTTKGTDQIYFELDSVKGNNGYSSSVNPVVYDWISPMVNKLIQPEGFSMISLPGANEIDGSYSIYMVDNKEQGYMYMRTGNLGGH